MVKLRVNRNPRTNESQQMGDTIDAELPRKRSRLALILTVGALVVAAGQLFNIQVVRGAELAEQGRLVRTSASSIQAPRGEIVDSTGHVLADSKMTYHIAVNQKNIAEYRHVDEAGKLVGAGPAEAAALLAPVLDMDPSELGGQLLGDSSYQYLAKNVDEEIYRQIRRMNIYGIEWEPVYERVYPAGSTASDVVGFVNQDGEGVAGLEMTLDDLLVGTPGEESYEIGATGEVIPGAKVVSIEAEPGNTIHTTFQLDLQHTVQEALDETVKSLDADWGAVVVREVSTPNVLVLAGSGGEDEDGTTHASPAVQMVYEPGSTAKLATFATALQEGTIGPETRFYVDDRLTTANGQEFKDIYEHGRLERTATGILAQSLNTGTVLIGETVTDEARYNTMRAFGLGETTGVELAGESKGILVGPEAWDGRTKYTTMFGQGFAITALQAATMASTIANGGVRVDPRVVAGVTDSKGVYRSEEAPAPVEVLRPEVSKQLLTMMESVMAVDQGGSAAGGNIEGYRLAAKTGTAEIMGTSGTIANVVAVLPADDPQVAISAVIYNPKGLTTAAEAAVPLMEQVALDTIRVLDIPPSPESPRLYAHSLTDG